MNKAFWALCLLAVAGALFIGYGWRVTPPPDNTVSTIAMHNANMRVSAAKAVVVVAKGKVKKSKVKVEEITLVAHESEVEYALTKSRPDATCEEKIVAADAALKTADDRAEALVEEITALDAEIAAHEIVEIEQDNEIELFSARIDELENQNRRLEDQVFWLKTGVAVLVGAGTGLWLLGL